MTNRNDCCGYGERIPAVWLIRNELHIAFAINGNGNYNKNFRIERKAWTKIRISQKQLRLSKRYISSRRIISKGYLYEIEVGKVKHTIINTRPEEFTNVKLYASDPWFGPFNGTIRNLEICGKGVHFNQD